MNVAGVQDLSAEPSDKAHRCLLQELVDEPRIAQQHVVPQLLGQIALRAQRSRCKVSRQHSAGGLSTAWLPCALGCWVALIIILKWNGEVCTDER